VNPDWRARARAQLERVPDPDGDVWEQIGWTDPERREGALNLLMQNIGQGGAKPTIARRRRYGGLTIPEVQAVAAVSVGMSMQAAADCLGRDWTTVRSQLDNARRILKARNLAHLVAICWRRSIID
jgi:DNA-binding CsgD family transcriptional regulator